MARVAPGPLTFVAGPSATPTSSSTGWRMCVPRVLPSSWPLMPAGWSSPADADRLPGHIRLRGYGPRPAGGERAPAAARGDAAGRAAGRGRKLSAPPVAETARLLGIEVFQPGDVNGEEARAAIAAADRRRRDLRLRGAHQGAAALGARVAERAPVATTALARRRAGGAGDRGRRRGDRRDHHEAGGGARRGPDGAQRAEAIGPDDDYGSLVERLAALGGELLVEALDLQPAFREQPDTGVTYAEKIGPGDRRLDPALAADLLERGRAPSDRTSAPTSSCPGTSASASPVAALAAGGEGRTGRAGRVGRPASCTARPAAHSSCARCTQPGKRPWTPMRGSAVTATGSD